MTRRSKYTLEIERRFGKKLKDRSIDGLAKFFKIKKSYIQEAFDRGVGAFKTNRSAVRKGVNNPETWAYPRAYKMILNVLDEKIPTGRGSDADLVIKELKRRNKKIKLQFK